MRWRTWSAVPLIEHPDIVERLVQRFARRGLQMPEVNRRQAPGDPGRRRPRESEWHGARADGRCRRSARHPPAGTAARAAADDGCPRRGAARGAGRSGAAVSRDALHRRPRGVARRRAGAAGLLEVAAGHAADRDDDPRRAWSDRTAFRHAIGRRRGGRRALAAARDEILAVLGSDVFSTDGRSMEEIVGQLLLDRKLTISAAESCTGGLLLSRLTDIPGSSAYVAGRGRRVQQCAQSGTGGRSAGADRRARGGERAGRGGARRRRSSRRPAHRSGVGITGIAGPSGGTPQKPVGTVAVAVAQRGRVDARPHVLALRIAVDDQVPGGADGARHGAPDSAEPPEHRILAYPSRAHREPPSRRRPCCPCSVA